MAILFPSLILASISMSFLERAPWVSTCPGVEGEFRFKVHCLTKASDFFPETWVREHKARADAVGEADLKRAVKVVANELRAYPESMVEALLRELKVAGAISINGILIGGSNAEGVIFLSVGSVQKGYTNKFLRKVFHHELSSLFLRRARTNDFKKQWNRVNPPGFRYRGDGRQALEDGNGSRDWKQNLFSQGFLAAYGQASLEEDFNMIAESVMTEPKRFRVAMEGSARLRAKYKLWWKLMRSIDGQFQSPLEHKE